MFYTTYDPTARGYMLEVALDVYDCDFGPEDTGCEEGYANVEEHAAQWFDEWFFDSLPDEAGEREATRTEEDYVLGMAQDFAELVLEDIEGARDWEETKRSLMGPL